MKEPFIPLEKRSKKEQRAWYAKRRRDWNGVPPATRIIPSKKHYDRKKQRREQFPDAVFALQGIDGRGNGPQTPSAQILPNNSRFSCASSTARTSSSNQASTAGSSRSVSHQRKAAVRLPSSL